MNKDKALTMALEWIQAQSHPKMIEAIKVIDAIKEVLERPQPFVWMTRESMWTLTNGHSRRGAVPVHLKKSRKAQIPLYLTPPLRRSLPFNERDLKSLDESLHFAYRLGWISAETAHGIKEKP